LDAHTDTLNTTKKPNTQTEGWNHASTINKINSPQKSANIQPSTLPFAPLQTVAYETPSIVSVAQFSTDNSARPQRNRHPPKKYTELDGDIDPITL
jgi:hypothetical protein